MYFEVFVVCNNPFSYAAKVSYDIQFCSYQLQHVVYKGASTSCANLYKSLLGDVINRI